MRYNDEHILRPGRLWKKEAGNTQRKQLIDKSGISRPVGVDSSASATLASIEELRKFSPQIPNPPKIDTRNLGTAKEALNSHPIRLSGSGRLERYVGTLLASPDREPSRSEKEIKNYHRKLVIYESDDEVLLRGPGPSKHLFGERQQGNGSRKPENAKENVEEGIEETIDCTIPTIRLVPPPEGDVEPLGTRFLSVDEAYKTLFQRSKRENRTLRGLLPLAWLLAEAEGIDIHDTAALVEALEGIIEDRQRSSNLLSLASTLCADQDIDFETGAFENLPRALDKVLKDREAAKFAAGHEKRVRQRLERRVIQLENTLSELRCDGNEDFQYFRAF
ncbi:hypothetical protein F5X97DRAFT_317912 [Nemania serpens]|nr:hypothetical protein F5X97DRAFT_317912 [Nemania serpens]